MNMSDAVLRLFQPVFDILCYHSLIFKLVLFFSPIIIVAIIVWITKTRGRRNEHV